MPNPKLARKLAYLSGLLFATSFALMVAQILGDMPIGLAMYAALGAIVAWMGWLAMWAVSKVHAMQVAQMAMLAQRLDESPTAEIKIPVQTVRSAPVAVAVTTRPMFEGETFQPRPTVQRRVRDTVDRLPKGAWRDAYNLGRKSAQRELRSKPETS